LFYSLFGMLRLGVMIDAMLLIGGIGLIGQHLQNRRRRALPASTRLRSAMDANAGEHPAP
jgi:hypothetical protein